MLRIGLTGNMGSGKSTVARIFQSLGIPVYNADTEAKRLMLEDVELQQSIRESFGEMAFQNNILNRSFLANQVFNDAKKLALLNSLVHPVTIRDAVRWMREQNSPYVIKEAAIIFESGSDKNLDFVIGVQSPETLRIERAAKRDGVSHEMIKARMDRQMDEEKKMSLCKYVIINDERQLLIPQVLQLHEKFLKL
ncbi:MAG: dephospho-CoA kinase [Ginsengibacter sp.]